MLNTGTIRFSIASGSRKRSSRTPFSTAHKVTCSARNPLGTGTTRSNWLDLSLSSPKIFNLSLSASNSTEISELEYPATANFSVTSLSSAGGRSASPEATLTSTFGKVIFGTTTRKTPSHTKPLAFSMSYVAFLFSLIVITFPPPLSACCCSSPRKSILKDVGTPIEERSFDSSSFFEESRRQPPVNVTFTSLADTPGTFIFTIVPRFVSLVCTCLPLHDVVVESARFSCCDCCPRGTDEEKEE